MLLKLRVLLLSFILTLAGVTIAGASPGIMRWQQHQVLWVHHCEGDLWHSNGSIYKGGLGWRPATWNMFRLHWMPVTMNLASPREQMIAMIRFANRYGWPDQNGICRGY